ncbi:hypothetical protein EUGRSUZ_K01115 [Eucalyptus grandis]|uniref:Uncharacterized protein n=2 Tax=Eucalyptus grandis TaxID=71139 RepID=A0ACC3IU46_EUCGR|nr:hypothetical protein EUGRSUZ_K01115 [Eucalyptus grandis]
MKTERKKDHAWWSSWLERNSEIRIEGDLSLRDPKRPRDESGGRDERKERLNLGLGRFWAGKMAWPGLLVRHSIHKRPCFPMIHMCLHFNYLFHEIRTKTRARK